MRRRAWNITTVLSAFAFAAVLVLWGLSYFRVLGLSNSLYKGQQERGESGIWSTGGRVLFDTTRHTDVSRVPGWRGATFSNDPYVVQPQFVDQPSVTRWHALGFRVAQSLSPSVDGTVAEFAAVTVPYWAIAALASLTFLSALRPVLSSRRRHLMGQCERCGYDLRGTVGNCPECGAPAPTRITAAV